MLSILLAVTVAGALRLSEVMPDPSRVDDSRGEYVEVENPGANPFVGRFRLVIAGKDTIPVALDTIAPGGFWILSKVLESDNGGFRADLAIPNGWTLANSAGRVSLLDEAGTEIDSFGWTASTSGAAIERCPDGRWKPSTTTYGAGDRGTPGSPNSCDPTPRPLEGSVDSFFRRGDSLQVVVRNRGLDAWNGRTLRWTKDGDVVRTDSLFLASGASRALGHQLPAGGDPRTHWVARLPKDVRPTDDSLGLWVRDSAGEVVISEIQPANEGPEWIELAQGLDAAFPIGGWTIGGQSPRGVVPAGAAVPAAGRLVLSSDCAALKALVGVSTLACAEPSPWPRLSSEEDAISLRDADGGLWDSVAWNRAAWGAWPKGKTRERQNPTPFGGAESWLPSAMDGGTPGYGPADASGWTDGTAAGRSFRIRSRRVRPGDAATPLRMEIAGPREEELRIDLYDMGRRHVMGLHDGLPPRGGILNWDGRDPRGRDAKPGVYVVVAEFGPSRKPTWKAKEWIVVSPSR